ncbi:sensor histidine kinase [Rubellimicrobium aerolatum]|uniref:histidine kinase n=1 Tax=Rubellimicrobium aerolatum TaxID=490979 RepID=A0ABW0S9C0_9RHOB|nr:PAS domain S-box-containing protein [Rubellimicrobium aerolatum]
MNARPDRRGRAAGREGAAREDRAADLEARLEIALDLAGLCTWDWDLTTGEVAWSEGHFRLHGYVPGEVAPSYEAWAARVDPEDLPATEARLRAARDEGLPYEAEFRVRAGPGEVRWCRARGRFLRSAEGRPLRMIGVMQDITALREAEARQRELLSELRHRVRGSLAMIRSVLRRSAATATGKEAYLTHVEGRIDALTRVQAAVFRSPGAELESLLRDEMQAAAVGADRLRLSGPEVRLPVRAAELLGLAFHELATNALKFGALAKAEGRLAVEWTVDRGSPPRLRLSWTESGGGRRAPPRRRGFGTELLERTLPYSLEARVALDHRPEGTRCTIELPLGG